MRRLSILFFSAFLIATPSAFAKPKTSCAASLRTRSLTDVYAMSMQELEDCLRDSIAELCAFETVPGESADSTEINTLEICAVHNYTTVTFGEINSGLWKTGPKGNGLTGEQWGYVRVFDHALSKIKPAGPLTVYRGTRKSKLALGQPGKVMRLKGYSSTSPDIEVAQWFLDAHAKDNLLMVIQSQSARKISDMAGAPEKEYLLPRSTWVRYERSEVKELTMAPEGEDKEYKVKVEFAYFTEVPAP